MIHGSTAPNRRSTKAWSGAVAHGGGPMAMMKGEKARDFKGTMRKLIQYLGIIPSYRS